MWQNIKQNLNLAIEQLRPAALLYLMNNAWRGLILSLANIDLGLPGFTIPRPPRTTFIKKWQPALRPVPGFSVALVATGLAGILFFSLHLKSHYQLEPVTYASPIHKVLPQKKPTVVPVVKTLPASRPVEIDIPSVNIDAPIVPTDLSSDGSIAVPDTPYKAGWYDKSPTPGQLGPSIIVGHVDFINVGIAVFWRLRYVQPGAEINVSRTDGSTARFKVLSVHQYSQSNFPDSVVYGNTNYAAIRLITCGGVFDTATGHYSDNTVIYGELE